MHYKFRLLILILPKHFALSIKGYNKLWPLAQFTVTRNVPTHLFNNLLANGKTKAGSIGITLRMLIQFAKIDEKMFHTFFRDSLTVIRNFDFHWNELTLIFVRTKWQTNTLTFFYFRRRLYKLEWFDSYRYFYLPLLWRKLYRIRN